MDVVMNSPGKSSFFTGVGKLLSEGPLACSSLTMYIQLFLDPVDILALQFVSVCLYDLFRAKVVLEVLFSLNM